MNWETCPFVELARVRWEFYLCTYLCVSCDCHVTVRWLEARWRDLYQREQLTFDEESRKIVVTTPTVKTPFHTTAEI